MNRNSQQTGLGQPRQGTFVPVMQLRNGRLELGAGTVIAQLTGGDPLNPPSLKGHEGRILALLAASYRRPISTNILDNVRRAGYLSANGESCLAHIHLALTGLPELTPPDEAAERLAVADRLLKSGISPEEIMRALDLDPSPLDMFTKDYNPDEARVPAGSGPTSGEWNGGGTVTGTMTTAAEAFLARDLPREALAGLASLSRSLAVPASILGFVFIPSPTTSTIVNGDIPDHPGLFYHWDKEEGRLVLARQAAGQAVPFLEAHIGQDGIFYDTDHRPVAREAGSSIVIDGDAIDGDRGTAAEEDADAKPIARTLPMDKAPKLCPDPGPDVPHGASANAIAYQARVTGLPPGLAVRLNGVVFDGCREEDGTMLEAKGPGYANFIAPSGEWYGWFTSKESLVQQLEEQSVAASNRRVEWHVAEQKAADKFRQMAGNLGLNNVDVIWDP